MYWTSERNRIRPFTRLTVAGVTVAWYYTAGDNVVAITNLGNLGMASIHRSVHPNEESAREAIIARVRTAGLIEGDTQQ